MHSERTVTELIHEAHEVLFDIRTQKRRLLAKLDSELKLALGSIRDPEKLIEAVFTRLLIRLNIFEGETPETAQLFQTFVSEVRAALEHAMGVYLESPTPQRARSTNILIQMLTSKLHTVSRSYSGYGMSQRVADLYVLRMDIMRYRARLEGNTREWLGIGMFRFISLYGTSFSRLSLFIGYSLIGFGLLYWFSDAIVAADQRMIGDLMNPTAYFYASLVTFTSLGIDNSPVTALQQWIVGIDSLYGVLSLGLLFNVISTKLSINS